MVSNQGRQNVKPELYFADTTITARKEIQLSDKSGNWLPYNLDNGLHDCRTKKQQEVTLQAVQEKLDSIGIVINLD